MKKLLSLFLTLALTFSLSAPCALAAEPATAAAKTSSQFSALESSVYPAMMALQSSYPEGMPWTNDNYYGWNGGIYSGGYGCAGFAFLLSDAAFGALPARMLTEFQFEDVRVGDILRINSNTHSVIVLEVHEDHVVIAEGNYNNSVHWFRKLSKSQVEQATYLMTRYPSHTPKLNDNTILSDWAVEFVATADLYNLIPDELGQDLTKHITRAQFCALAVRLYETLTGYEMWYYYTEFADTNDLNMAKAYSNGIISGYNESFYPGQINLGPNDLITREQAAVMLCRLAESFRADLPAASSQFNDGISDWAKTSVDQVYGAGIMSGYSQTSFGPKDPYSMEQSLITMVRMMEHITK